MDGPNGIPLTCPGGSAVQVKLVLESIFSYAFVASDYPVIVLLNINCGAEQRKIIASLLVEIFGNSLALDNSVSPLSLKRKFLLQLKNGMVPERGNSVD
jgi:phosphatidylinositol phospholipase C delta